jgi:hypothetical protein
MQNDRIDVVLAAPNKHCFHKLACQSPATKSFACVDIENVAASHTVANHVRRPIHEPKTSAGRYGTVGAVTSQA